MAIFAIWLSLNQRKESQSAYDKTKNVLAELEKVINNFQNLLKSITDQQGQLLGAMKPKPNNEDIMIDLIVKIANTPDKLEKIMKIVP